MRGISGRSAIRRSKRRVSCVTFNLNSSKPSLLRCFLSCAPGFQSAVLPLPLLFSICHSAAVLAPALPPGTIRPRIPAFPHLFSLSSLLRSRRGPPAVRPSPSLPRKILPGIPERIFREQSSVHTVLAPLLLWFWWLLRRNVTALRPTDSVPNQSARVCRLRR